MKVVADTNIFLAVALNEPERSDIIRITKGYELVSPEVLPFEVGNTLSAMLKRQKLDANEVLAVWDVVEAIPVELRRIDIRKALTIAKQFDIYAYDAYFIECAILLRIPLLTLDRKMSMVAQEIGIPLLEIN